MKTGKKLVLCCIVLACTCALVASLVAQGPAQSVAKIGTARQAREATATAGARAHSGPANAAGGARPAPSVSNVSARPVGSVGSTPAGEVTAVPQLSKNSAGAAVMPPEGKTKAPSGRSKVYQAESPLAVQVTPALAPLDKKVTVQPTNTGGGMSCIHLGDSGTVTKHATSNRDHISGVQPTGLTDGTKDGYISVGYRVDHREYYSSGHTGGRGGAGDRPLLTANTYQHAQATLGACCDTSTGACTDTVEQADCLAGGEWMRWFAWETCDELNPLCEAIVGACCVQRTCLRVSPYQCYLAGGEYKGDGSSCDPNPCLCADFFVNAPGSWTGSTCGAGNDCGLRNTEEVIYAVTIPWDGTWIFDLCGSTFDTYMFVGTSCCGAELGYNDDYCNYQSQMTFTELAAGTYYMDIEGYSGCGSYVFNVHEVLGACCVNEVCVGDLKPAACYAQGGQWWSGMSCASFACPHWGCPESEITVTYVPDSQPYETSWQVVQEGTGATICTNPPMTTAFATYVTDCCVRSADCYDWNCQDAYGDGTYAPGGYEILFDGVVVAWTLGSGWYGSSVSVTQIGGCVFPGACCFWGDPFCAVMFEADCYGAWLGPWTDCGVLADCDDDYISDGCTIGMGLGLDCNGNGIPDSCDITDCHLLPPDERWWCQDCQPDGIPDGCQLAGGGSGPGLLYAPTEDDNPAFRAAVSAMIGVPVDYFDARSGTPTLTQMQGYAAVMTWVDYAYADDVTFGNNLADYVDGGGIVILGQWCALPAGEGFLGRIMWDAGYNPATATSWGASSYAGDGVACVHGGVTSYASDYRDNISLMPGAISDGTWLDGIPAIAYWPDYSPRVFYSPGNTGGSYSSGDWALLTANMITCVLGHQPHDCNGNLIPDECDIAQCDGSRWCRDCDHDGYPDGCECVSMGDLDNSGAVDGLDIQVFIDCALGSGDNCVCGDFDCNGRVGPGDLSEFVGALLAP